MFLISSYFEYDVGIIDLSNNYMIFKVYKYLLKDQMYVTIFGLLIDIKDIKTVGAVQQFGKFSVCLINWGGESNIRPLATKLLWNYVKWDFVFCSNYINSLIIIILKKMSFLVDLTISSRIT